MWSARAASATAPVSSSVPADSTRSSTSWVPVSLNGMLPPATVSMIAPLALDTDHVEPAVGEGQCQRQAHAAETHNRDASGHAGQSTSRPGRVTRSERYCRANESTKRGL